MAIINSEVPLSSLRSNNIWPVVMPANTFFIDSLEAVSACDVFLVALNESFQFL